MFFVENIMKTTSLWVLHANTSVSFIESTSNVTDMHAPVTFITATFYHYF